MILLSLVLVVASAAALGWGIATASEQLIWGSLLAGVLAMALVTRSVVRLRRRVAESPAPSSLPPEPASGPSPAGPSAGPAAPAAPAPSSPPAGPPAPPAQAPPAWAPAPPAGSWPWPVDPRAGAEPSRSGWTGPVSPPHGPPPTSTGPGPAPGQPAGAPPPADQPAATAPPPMEPVEPAKRHPAQEAATAALGAATDRPLGEPFADDGEPPPEGVPIRDALRVAQLADEVQVVDGRPRYHLDGCPLLAGADPVPIAVSAARRAGFTPCGTCRPDHALLGRARDRRRPAAD